MAIVTHFTACILSRQTHISCIYVKHLCCLDELYNTYEHTFCLMFFSIYLLCVFSEMCVCMCEYVSVYVWLFFVELISIGRRCCFSENFNLIGHLLTHNTFTHTHTHTHYFHIAPFIFTQTWIAFHDFMFSVWLGIRNAQNKERGRETEKARRCTTFLRNTKGQRLFKRRMW